MNRAQKEAVVAQVRDAMAQASATFLVDFQGAPVSTLQALRVQLRTQDAKMKVTKARLMKIAAQEVPGADAFAQGFEKQVGLVFAGEDVSAAAKEIVEFSKKNEAIKLLNGFFDEKVLSKEEVMYFAKLPSRQVLLGQVVGTLQAPIVSLARLFNALILRLLYVLQRIAEKKAAA